jgi:hypothetical protein
MKHLFLLAAAVLGLVLSGCSTFESRAKQRSATFESLAPAEREKLRQGVIELGNSPDMVYIALGDPDAKREKATAEGRETIWTYNTYHQDYEGPMFAGYRRHLVYDRYARRYVVYHEPVFTEVYSEHAEENIRIKFRNDRVVEIEQPKTERAS